MKSISCIVSCASHPYVAKFRDRDIAQVVFLCVCVGGGISSDFAKFSRAKSSISYKEDGFHFEYDKVCSKEDI